MERLVYKTVVISLNGERTIVWVKLADDCKKGYQHFSVTCDILLRGRDIGGGASHEHINKVTKGKLADFTSLHLADSNGIPMYAVENGYYHINKDKLTEEAFCSAYRVTPAQYKKLCKAVDVNHFNILLNDLGIIKQWKQQADAAIKRLEGLTGQTFTPIMTRNPYMPPSEAQRALYEAQRKQGYYTARETKKRQNIATKVAKENKIRSLWRGYAGEVRKITDKLRVDLVLVDRLGDTGPIYYNHTNTVVFNWQSGTPEYTQETFDSFLKSLTKADYKALPKGITFKLTKV